MVMFLELRQQGIDTAVFTTRHLGHSVPGRGAACDGGQDADTAQGPRLPAPARQSTAALRSAGEDQVGVVEQPKARGFVDSWRSIARNPCVGGAFGRGVGWVRRPA
jgi:hypothetical protein